MLKLSLPAHTCEQAIEKCSQGITGNDALLQKVNSEGHLLQAEALTYVTSASTGELYTIPSTANPQNGDQIVLGTFSKSELIKLYGSYFVPQGKPARIIYDALMAAANEKCPFCGGIGRPRNLDHYLPKTLYPKFSILPVNLIPSCRDCNMEGKGDAYPSNESEQVLQPYLDHDRYFNEQWISAHFIAGTDDEPGAIEFFVQPPEHWSDAQKQRVTMHFVTFSLGVRFSKEASARLLTYLEQIKNLLRIPLGLDTAKSTILQPAIDKAPFVNHWERVMCLALMNDLNE